MLAVTFIRAKQIGQTQILVYFGNEQPLSYVIENAIYTPSPSLNTYVGLNFSGLLRLLTIYMRYNFNTKFDSMLAE